MKDYGVRVYRNGVDFHGDGRKRGDAGAGRKFFVSMPQSGAGRGRVTGLSRASRRTLEFVAANAAVEFRTHMTLTYRARVEEWETDGERNARIVRRSKKDLNRFLSALRREVGLYLWVREFQLRGVLHYHVLCVGEVSEERVRVVWCRAIKALGDVDAVRYGTKVEPVEGEDRVRRYMVRYMGKGKQKVLPAGVEAAGRWWGCSLGMPMAVLDEVVSCEAGATVLDRPRMRVVRTARKFVARELGRKYRGGVFVHWGGGLVGRLVSVLEQLREFFGVEESVFEWARAGKADEVNVA